MFADARGALTAYNGILKAPEALQLLHYEDWGSDKTYPHMAVQWAWAFDSPFKWTKQVASHFGGTRQGLAISWPGHIDDVWAIRTQFHHVIDIVPTILEAAGIKAPDVVNGIKQRPIEGVSNRQGECQRAFTARATSEAGQCPLAGRCRSPLRDPPSRPAAALQLAVHLGRFRGMLARSPAWPRRGAQALCQQRLKTY